MRVSKSILLKLNYTLESRLVILHYFHVLKREHFEYLIVEIVCLVMVSYTNNVMPTIIYRFNKLFP